MTLTIVTYDRVDDLAKGHVRDLRARWACEEAGLAYEIATVPLDPKSADSGQPAATEGDGA